MSRENKTKTWSFLLSRRDSLYLCPLNTNSSGVTLFHLIPQAACWCCLRRQCRASRRPGGGTGGTVGALGGEVELVVFVVLEILERAVLVAEAGVDIHLAEAAAKVVAAARLPADQGRGGVDLEAVDAGHVPLDGLQGDKGGVDLEEDVVEGGAEVGAVDSGVAGRLWIIDVLAASAVQLDGLEVGHVGEAHGQQRVGLAHDAGALSEVALLVLFQLPRYVR